MKNNKLIIVCVAAVIIFTSCLKKIDIPQSNTATVTFASSGANFVTTDITVNPKDSIFFNFSVESSSKDMRYVGIQKNPADLIAFIAKDTLNAGNKNLFSATKRFAADSAAGVYKYRVLALDSAGIYIGSKEVTVTVTADFNFYSFRTLYVPDTTAKTNQTYFATTTGQTYSYSTVGTNSGLIDFGYFYDTASAKKHTIYALNITPVPSQFSFYDISTWTKNATIFKKVTTPTFASFTSSGSLRTAGLANLSSGTSSSIPALAANNIILFKTAAGKYGAIQVNYINTDGPAATTYMNIDVKVQK
jgi:hypothetical protein